MPYYFLNLATCYERYQTSEVYYVRPQLYISETTKTTPTVDFTFNALMSEAIEL